MWARTSRASTRGRTRRDREGRWLPGRAHPRLCGGAGRAHRTVGRGEHAVLGGGRSGHAHGVVRRRRNARGLHRGDAVPKPASGCRAAAGGHPVEEGRRPAFGSRPPICGRATSPAASRISRYLLEDFQTGAVCGDEGEGEGGSTTTLAAQLTQSWPRPRSVTPWRRRSISAGSRPWPCQAAATSDSTSQASPTVTREPSA